MYAEESRPNVKDPRCYECGSLLDTEDMGFEFPSPIDAAEVYLDPETLKANAGGQWVLVDDMPDEEFGPFLVHADPCFRAQRGGLPKYTLA